MFKRLLRCKEGNRCHLIHCCEDCASNYQKHKFVMHTKELKNSQREKFFYCVIGSKYISTLNNNINEIKEFMRSFSALSSRKRGIFKSCDFFMRLEVSFKPKIGFYPHLNIMFFNVDKSSIESELYNILDKHNLKIRIFSKDNNINTIKSILWYILKYNKMDWRKAMAVQIATKGLQEIRYSKMFKYTDIDKLDDEIFPILDMSFLMPMNVRTRKEVSIRASYSNKIKKIRSSEKYALSKLRKCACGCGRVLDTKRKYFDKICMLNHREKLKKV